MPELNTAAPARQGGGHGKTDRPKKPYPDFPLSFHASGRYQKKVRGRIHYFGHWARREGGVLVPVPGGGWQEALAEYKRVADELHAGRTPREDSGGLTVADLCNHFRTAKTRQVEAGELSGRMLADYVAVTDRLVKTFGGDRLVSDLRPEDFASMRVALSKRFGPTRLTNEVQRTRTVFKFAADNGLVPAPVLLGSEFRPPSRKTMRVFKSKRPPKLFEPAELRAVIDAAGVPLRAMILLGVNCGFGNSDVSAVPLSSIDLDGGWVAFPRGKTGVPRRAKLWPETVEAVKAAVAARPDPKDLAHAVLAFLTRFGAPWLSGKAGGDAVKLVTEKLLRKLGVKRPGLGFYTFRHTFRTVADGARDLTAVRTVMGHADASIDANYTHRIDDARLVSVAEFVRAWLFPVVVG